MKKCYSVVLFAAALAWMTSGDALAQGGDATPISPTKRPPRIYVGPVAGINLVQHTGEFASFASSLSNLCPSFQGGSNIGFYAGLSAEYLLGDVAKSSSSIIARLVYDTRPATFTETDAAPNVYLLDRGGEQIPTSVLTEYAAVAKYNMINLDLLYKYSIGNTGIAVTGGLALGLVNTATVKEDWKILTPLEVQFNRDAIVNPGNPGSENFVFTENDRVVTFRDGDIPNKSGFRVGAKVGIQYEISMSKMFIVPTMWYDFGLTSVNSTDSWRVNALQLGVDIRFAL